jgi:hypothetical protein
MASIKLVNGHLVLEKSIADALFSDAAHVSAVYYPDRKALLMASAKDELFRSLHKTGSYLLKEKNVHGDKAVSLEAIIIDNEIDRSDREPPYEADEVMKILSIYF